MSLGPNILFQFERIKNVFTIEVRLELKVLPSI